MAVRIHVTATQASQDVIRRHFRDVLGDSFDRINIGSTPPWNFFTTSVWGVAASKLIEGLQRLGAPGLQATTEDGSRWILTLVRPDQPPQSFLHDFYLFRSEYDPEQTADPPEPEEIDPRLAFLEPDPDPASQRPWSQFDSVADDYASMGVPVEEKFRDRVAALTYGAAVNEFQQYEVNRFADALSEAGLQFDRSKLIDALLWKSATEREKDADIGNLPGVLLSLGLQGSIAAFFHAPEAEEAGETAEFDDDSQYDADSDTDEEDIDEEDEDFDEEHIDDAFDEDYHEEHDDVLSEGDDRESEPFPERIRNMERSKRQFRGTNNGQRQQDQWGQDTFLSVTRDAASIHALLPIRGGNVELPPSEITLLDFFAQAISAKDSTSAVITIIPPDEGMASRICVANPNCTDIEVRPGDGCWYIGLSSLDMIVSEISAVGDDDFLVSYLGQELTDYIRRPPEGTGVCIDFADTDVPGICLRFSGTVVNGHWQIAESFPQLERQTLVEALSLARQQEQTEYELIDETEAGALLQAARRDAYLYNMGVTSEGNKIRCEHDGMGFVARLILRHRFAHVWDFSPALRHIEEEFKERQKLHRQMLERAAAMRRERSAPADRSKVLYRGKQSVYFASDLENWSVVDKEQLSQLMSALSDLGFRHIGDFVCRKLREYAQRVLISADRKSWAVIPAGAAGLMGHEFVSHFTNGSHLTTSTSWLAQNHPEVDVYAQFCEGAKTADLHERHLWGIGRFLTHKQTEPIELDDSPGGVCRLFDEILGRMKNVESGLVSFEAVKLDENY